MYRQLNVAWTLTHPIPAANDVRDNSRAEHNEDSTDPPGCISLERESARDGHSASAYEIASVNVSSASARTPVDCASHPAAATTAATLILRRSAVRTVPRSVAVVDRTFEHPQAMGKVPLRQFAFDDSANWQPARLGREVSGDPILILRMSRTQRFQGLTFDNGRLSNLINFRDGGALTRHTDTYIHGTYYSMKL